MLVINSKIKKTGQKIGSLVGKFAGSYVPFEKGGIVKPPKGQNYNQLFYIKEN